jgi:hypothetical protein
MFLAIYRLGEMTQPTVCETRLAEKLASFERQHDALIEAHLDSNEEIVLVRTLILTIRRFVHISSRVNGNGAVWKELTEKAEAQRTVLCKHLDGKALFTGMLRLYAATHRKMKILLNLKKWKQVRNSAIRRAESERPQIIKPPFQRKPQSQVLVYVIRVNGYRLSYQHGTSLPLEDKYGDREQQRRIQQQKGWGIAVANKPNR